MIRWTACALALVLAAAHAAAAAPRVDEVIGAPADVRAIAVAGGDTLLGTAAGVVVVRAGGIAQSLGTADGLAGARVMSLSATERGIWAGGSDGATLLVRDGTRYRAARTLPLHRVTRVVQFAGATYFATFGDGLWREAPGRAPVRVAIGRDRRRVSDLLVAGDRLWVATIDDGIVRLAAGGARDEVRGLASDVVWDLEVDGSRVLAATAAGVDAIAARGGARPVAGQDALPVHDVRAVACRDESIYVATFGAGTWLLARGRARVVDASTEARALALDGEHVLVGTPRGATRDGQPLVPTGGLPSADVTALARAFGALWVGTFAHGIARVAGGQVTVPAELAALDPRINDLAVTRAGARERLWIATDRGLWSYDGAVLARELDPAGPGDDHVTGLHVDPAGALWVAAGHRLARRDEHGWRSWTPSAAVPLGHLDAVTTDRAGHVWVAGLHGVVELSPTGEVTAVHTAATGALAVDWATAVIPWRGGVVIGTYDAGLSWYDGEGVFRQDRSAPAGWVNPHAMLASGDQLWFGTLDRGLVIGRPGAWQRLGIADGLPSADITALLPAGARAMWVGTRGGLARVTW